MSNVRLREVQTSTRTPGEAPTPDDLEIIGRPDMANHPVGPDEVHVRMMRLAHNQYDRTFERFPKAYLDRFAATAPGKAVLHGHDRGGEILGRFFRAETRARTEAAFPMLMLDADPAAPNRRVMPRFENRAQRVTWMEPAFYFPNDVQADGLRNRIDLGVYKDASIGFRYDDLLCDICQQSYLRSDCPHIISCRTDSGAVVTGTYGGDPNLAEMIEGSIVFMGAQQHARLVRALHEGSVDPKALAQTPYGEDLVLLKEAEAVARTYGYARKTWAFPALALIVEHTDPGEAGKEIDDMTDEEKAVLEQAAVEAKAQIADLEGKLQASISELAEVKAVAADRESLAAIGEKALASTYDELVKHYVRLERGPDFALLAKSWLESRDFDKLVAARDTAAAEVLARFPVGTSGQPPQPAAQLGEPIEVRALDNDPAMIRQDILAR